MNIKKKLKPDVEAMLDAPYRAPKMLDEQGLNALTAVVTDDPTNADRIAAALVSKASCGDMKAYGAILSILDIDDQEG